MVRSQIVNLEMSIGEPCYRIVTLSLPEHPIFNNASAWHRFYIIQGCEEPIDGGIFDGVIESL